MENRLKYIVSLITIMFIASCSSTGVLPHTEGTYTVSTNHFLPAEAKQMAYEEAIDFCSKKGKEMAIVQAPDYISERYSIIFRCK